MTGGQRTLLLVSLGLNVAQFVAYSTRYKEYNKLAETHVNLAYRTNSLLQQHNLEPDAIILQMLKDVGVR